MVYLLVPDRLFIPYRFLVSLQTDRLPQLMLSRRIRCDDMRITQGSIGTVQITGDSEVSLLSGAGMQSLNAVTVGNTATILQAADTGTMTMVIKAAAGNGELIYIGDVGLTNPSITEDGVPLSAGEALVIDTSAAIYAISETGSQKAYLVRISKT